ncbi:non-specific serine/threonine protein kinase [Ranunculus cassubicifolius]
MHKEKNAEKKNFPLGAENYSLLGEIGKGGSASVYRAICTPLGEEVAIKIVDMQELSGADSISKVAQETINMLLVDHPNVMKSYSSFATGMYLWIVMPYMDAGSCSHLLQAGYPHGIQDEGVLATILYESLKGLEYLHHSGIIHRDVKAGNILVDGKTGTIKLGDLGVSACLYNSERGRSLNTFVGTPCWMAPEVMEASAARGYDLKADIWSFGITALELAYGHAPFHGLTPLQVLVKTLNGPPPSIQSYYKEAGNRKFSKSFQQLIAACLVKEPGKRPCAKNLLKHSFFNKAAHSSGHSESVVRNMLKQLPLSTFEERLESLRSKQDKMVEKMKELVSDCRYKGGVSDWDFDIDSFKKQTSLLPEDGLNGGDSCRCCLVPLKEDSDKEVAPALDEFKTEVKLPVRGVQSCSGTKVLLQASPLTPASMLHTMHSTTINAW